MTSDDKKGAGDDKKGPARTVAVLALLQTDDPQLWPENLDTTTVAKTAALRQVVIKNLPNLTRLVLVTSEENARLMMTIFDEFVLAAGGEVTHPPKDYIPPGRE